MGKMSVSEFYQGLDELYAKERIGEVEAYMQDARDTAANEDDTAMIIAVDNELASHFRSAGRPEQGLPLYEEALQKLEEIGQKDTHNYAITLLNAANGHLACNDLEAALKMYRTSEKLLEDLGEDNGYDMAAVQDNISSAYRSRGELEKAEAAALRSLRIIRTIPGARREEATSLINLGEVQTDMGRYDEAESSLGEAMKIYETEFADKDIHYAYAAAAFGVLEYYRGNWDGSIVYYQKAMELVERDFGRSPYYDMLENNLKIVREAKSGEAKS